MLGHKQANVRRDLRVTKETMSEIELVNVERCKYQIQRNKRASVSVRVCSARTDLIPNFCANMLQ